MFPRERLHYSECEQKRQRNTLFGGMSPVVEFHGQKRETVESCSEHSIQTMRRPCSTCGRWKVVGKSDEVQTPCTIVGSIAAVDPKSFCFSFSSAQTILVHCPFCRPSHRAPCTAHYILYLTIFVSSALCYRIAAAKNAVCNGAIAIENFARVVSSGNDNRAAGTV